jgi:hypothetical protein
MSVQLPPNIPMWTRGEPGFYIGQYADARWFWQFRDARGDAVEGGTIAYDTFDDAARFCHSYWSVASEALTQLCRP